MSPDMPVPYVMSPILAGAIYLSIAILMLALLVTAFRVIVGPTTADRVLALDQMVAIAIGFVALFAVQSGFSLYVDIAMALGLVGFLATAALARYLYTSGPGGRE